jgi:hypothetical protein
MDVAEGQARQPSEHHKNQGGECFSCPYTICIVDSPNILLLPESASKLIHERKLRNGGRLLYAGELPSGIHIHRSSVCDVERTCLGFGDSDDT